MDYPPPPARNWPALPPQIQDIAEASPVQLKAEPVFDSAISHLWKLTLFLDMLKSEGYYLFMANVLSTAKRAAIIATLSEGNSVRATCRLTGCSKGAALKLIGELGEACLNFQYAELVNLPCETIQADELWSYVGAKEKTAASQGRAGEFGFGDCWVYTAICADSRLILSWLPGKRDTECAIAFMLDIQRRLSGRVQLSTDGLPAYATAVKAVFGEGIDYAQVIKQFVENPEARGRYNPSKCTGIEKVAVIGNPDPDLVSTSYLERSNLSIRTTLRRFTRLTNGFSKKMDNHSAALAISFQVYNFVKPHGTLSKEFGQPTTPAMAAGLASAPWTYENVVELMATHSDKALGLEA
jgi:IS1 family transposase